MSRIRVVPIILVAIVALAILFGGFQFYQHYNVVSPVQTDLQKVSGVKSVQIVTGSPTSVDIKLNKVSDLQSTYKEISKKASNELNSSVKIHISDNASPALQKEYENIFPVLSEGIAKGNYTEMIAQVTKTAASHGIQTKVTMDAQDVFVQMTKGSHYLYKVVPYKLWGGDGVS
ncbi:hypothetical protein [Alicyclobacillus sp. SO9]|uniref:hypothetical protein n=1 Tax=Alicyclobacillus sp. SO9 TaxID=2665646 RepID=UPI0018E8A595|nr:hypothetical protein [Alicyclobacillus sp. SO9]QQE76769.1 hypothetical protein GI364_12125 [Alicyclobacillus sp. SO9]